MSDKKLTVKEAAARADYTVDHMRRLLREGAVKGTKKDKRWLVSSESLEAYLERVAT